MSQLLDRSALNRGASRYRAIACLVLCGAWWPLFAIVSVQNAEAFSGQLQVQQQQQQQQQQQATAGSIVGVVTASGRPVAGAIVSVADQGVITREDGTFLLDGVSGEVVLTVRMIGYARYDQPVVVSGETRVNIELGPQSAALEEIVAVAERPFRLRLGSWLWFVVVLVGLEVGLRVRGRPQQTIRRGPALGVTAGVLVFGLSEWVVALWSGRSYEPLWFLVGTAFPAVITAVLVLCFLPGLDRNGERIFTAVGAGVLGGFAGHVVLRITSIAQGGFSATSGLLDPRAITPRQWESALLGLILALWLWLRVGRPAATSGSPPS